MSKIFIVAEAGVNHNGNIDIAKALIDKAAEAGADAVKFQTFKAENIVCQAATKTVIHCGYAVEDIENAMQKALSPAFREAASGARNPYEGDNTSQFMIDTIESALRDGICAKKKFYDLT